MIVKEFLEKGPMYGYVTFMDGDGAEICSSSNVSFIETNFGHREIIKWDISETRLLIRDQTDYASGTTKTKRGFAITIYLD
jgi:hypothetical protein